MDLGFYYNEPNNRMLCGQPSVGDYLCLNSVSGTYYRALVLDFSQPLGLYFHHKEKAKVRYGNDNYYYFIHIKLVLYTGQTG